MHIVKMLIGNGVHWWWPALGVLLAGPMILVLISGLLPVILFLSALLLSILFGVLLLLETNRPNVAESYRLIRDRNPIHFVAEREPFRDHFRRMVQQNTIVLVSRVEFNRRFTGHTEIDRQLNEIFRLFFRHHIEPWSTVICPEDQEFSQKLYQFFHQTVTALIRRLKTIDVADFLMTKVVEELARHRRLYRIAQTQLDYTRLHSGPELAVAFLRLERKSEKTYRHETICQDRSAMLEFMTYICDILMYSLLPEDSFQNETFIVLVKQMLVKLVLVPLFETLSEPDFINRMLISVLKSANCPSTETFIGVLQCSDDVHELRAVLESVESEMSNIRSKDDQNEDEFRMKQQLNSLIYLRKIILSHLKKFDLDEPAPPANDETGSSVTANPQETGEQPLPNVGVSLDAILRHNVALGYFINYMSTIDSEHYVNFYINVQAFKISLEQGLFEIYLTSINDSVTNEQYQQLQTVVHDTAMNIYQTYLAPEASSILRLVDRSLCQQVFEMLSAEDSSLWMNDCLFDDVYYQVRDIILTQEEFFPAFRRSRDYQKLLAESDLDDGFERNIGSPQPPAAEEPNGAKKKKNSFESLRMGFGAEIIDTGTLTIQGKSFIGYLIQIESKNGDQWTILRRYSEFFAFHQTVLDKCEKFHLNLKSILLLPPKTVLKNRMDETFIQNRRYWLNLYLKRLNYLYEKFIFLREDIEKFLQPGSYNHATATASMMSTNKNLIFNPIRTIGSVFKNHSESILDGFHRLGRTFSLQTDLNRPPPPSLSETTGPPKRILQTGSLGYQKPATESLKRTSNSSNDLSEYGACGSSGASSGSGGRSPNDERPRTNAAIGDAEEESLPLLSLLDEMFDLKNQNFWLRRRIIELFRQFVEVAYSDMINKRMGDYVNEWTSTASVANYLENFKNAFWPDGWPAESGRRPKEETTLRRKVAAKALILTFFADFRKVIGNESLHAGLMTTFELFQNKTLNFRLLLVLAEITLKELFPDGYMDEIFHHIYSGFDSGDLSCGGGSGTSNSNHQNWPPYLAKFVAKS